ncbi:MAG: Brp/Blh family beta-carotene 15,15'-dioxygenase, partial [Bacteroidota bacterium]
MRHASALLRTVTVCAGLLFVLLALAFPGWNALLAPWVVLAAVFLIGIPHGAIDHVMAAELYRLHATLKDYLLFYGGYLILMLLVGALWYFLPVGGMILFLSISIYHFGQADMEDFLRVDGGGPLPAPVWHVVRGLLIIGLIVFSDSGVTYPILAEAMRIPEAGLDSILPVPAYGIAVVTGPYVLAASASLAAGQIVRPWHFL